MSCSERAVFCSRKIAGGALLCPIPTNESAIAASAIRPIVLIELLTVVQVVPIVIIKSVLLLFVVVFVFPEDRELVELAVVGTLSRRALSSHMFTTSVGVFSFLSATAVGLQPNCSLSCRVFWASTSFSFSNLLSLSLAERVDIHGRWSIIRSSRALCEVGLR